jgi:ParB family chromosome partitioning protein
MQMEIVNLPLELIDEDTEQPRYQFDEESIQELMNSIAELGLLSPIKVRKLQNGRFKIIYGNRRYKASKNLGLASIPCIVTDMTDEKEIYLEQIAENLTREGFTPIEEAEAYDRLMNDPKFSSSIKFLSSKLGKSESYIKNKLELLKFDPKVRRLVVSGTAIRKDKLTEDQLLPLKDLPMEHRDTLALIVARDELPVSDVKKIAKLFKDKDISAATKDKLLYKSGYELLQTWSTLEANRAERAERAKRAAEREESVRAPKAASKTAQAQSYKSDAADSVMDPTPVTGMDPASAPIMDSALVVENTENGVEPVAGNANGSESSAVLARLESHLKQLLAAMTPVVDGDSADLPKDMVQGNHGRYEPILGMIHLALTRLDEQRAALQIWKDRLSR